MKYRLLNALTAAMLFLMPNVTFGQTINLGTAANFVLFTTTGAMTNSGVPHLTHLTGEVGSNLAASVSGFGNVDGQIHVFDGVTATCTSDVVSAYNQLNSTTPTATHAVLLGSETLFAGVYNIVANATLGSTLILDAQGNANAVFIFQIHGTFSTTTLSKVKLINGALACNVYWQVEGLVSVASGTTLRGTIIAHNAAIDMTSTLDTLEGRALSINGAVTMNALMAYTPIGCGSAVLTGPAAPPLVAAGAFGVFSSIGAVTATPVTYVIGDVGSNSTTTTGFNPLNVTGTIHASPDATTAAAAGNLTTVYNYLNGLVADIDLTDPANFGFDLVLTPHIYLLNAATMLNGSVYLNAEGDANAIFVLQVNGQFTTTTLSKIMLINGTQAKNVYWLINGAVHIFDNSLFNGTIVGAGAITLNTGDTLNGRALTINGAIAINGSYVTDVPTQCVASSITGISHVCQGLTTTLSDPDGAGTWTSSNTNASVGSSSGIVTGINPGVSVITYTSSLSCVNTISVTVNPSPASITGPNSVCVSSSINLSDITSGGAWSSSNTSLATVGTGSGIVTGVAAGTPNIIYTIPTGCTATKSVTVNAATSPGTITGFSGVCVSSSITLSDNVTGGIWSSINTNATVGSVSGVVTGMVAGTDSIKYTITSGCGTSVTAKYITINTGSNAGTISGLSAVCVGSVITLSDNVADGTWSASNTTATVSGGGIVTGVAPGTVNIIYSVNNGCGLATTTHSVTVNASPNAGTITGLSTVCIGSSIILSDGTPGGIWSSSNTTAAVLGGTVTGATAGIDTIMYTVTNVTCVATATKSITINTPPNAGVITGPSSVCAGFSITLSDGAPAGLWSSSNTTATVSGGVVTGSSAGIDTIRYSVTNGCGTDTATKIITINPLPDAGTITGPSSVCVGSLITLSDGSAGGVWSTSNTSATVVGGVVTGITAGASTVRYTVTNTCGTLIALKFITVGSSPNTGSITGISTVCQGANTVLSDAAGSGVWTSVSTAIATIGSSTGIVTGILTGTSIISYTVTNGCGPAAATATVTVSPLPNAGTITGNTSVCPGSMTTLTDAISGGNWTSVNMAAATIGSSTGIVSGIATGTTTISYTVTNSCGTAAATAIVTVGSLPDAGAIIGVSNICNASSFTYTESVTGGTWSIANANAAFVPVAGGILVTGVTTGEDTIRYSVTNGCGTATATKVVTIDALPVVPVITTQAPSSACTGTMYQNYGTAIPPQVNTAYNWTAVNATVWAQGALHQYSLVSFTETGVATVSLNVTVISTGCTNRSTLTVNVGAAIAQTPVVTYFNNNFVCTPNNEDSYQWGYDDAHTLDSTILIGEINQNYINTAPDFTNKYYWAMTTSGGCLQKTYYIIPTAIQNVNNETTISVYPNPANDLLNVVINSTESGQIQVDVLNMIGQKINTVQAIDNKASISVASLPAGIYVINCYRNGIKIAGSKFVKN